MYRIAFYGKGGIGKSTISANISYLLSLDGSSVLHVGCDPKHDSTRLLTQGRSIRTFSSDTSADPVCKGINGILCAECGGAEPGKGCAGKGIELLFDRIAGIDADYRICDVLGDVVCGGFSIPSRSANCDSIVIVTSGEFMSLFAANNILRGLKNINPGKSVMGIAFNRRGEKNEEIQVKRFSEAVGLPILCDMPRSNLFAESEASGEALSILFPDSEEAKILRNLAETIRSRPDCHIPRPLSEKAMSDLAAGRPISNGPEEKKRAGFSFEGYDAERNITYVGEFVMPACTSHGAADGIMRIRDAAANFKKVINGMWRAVNNGPGTGCTAWVAAVDGLDICGKTGTAQNPRGADNSVFICFAPKDDPKIAVAAYVENAGFGATWAAPIASILIEKYLNGEISRPDLENRVMQGDLMSRVKTYN